MRNPQLLNRKLCMSDLYGTLNVSRSSTPEMIEHAFREKIKTLHNEEALKTLKMAYVILITSDLRAEYDAFQDMGGMKWSIKRGMDIMNRGWLFLVALEDKMKKITEIFSSKKLIG